MNHEPCQAGRPASLHPRGQVVPLTLGFPHSWGRTPRPHTSSQRLCQPPCTTVCASVSLLCSSPNSDGHSPPIPRGLLRLNVTSLSVPWVAGTSVCLSVPTCPLPLLPSPEPPPGLPSPRECGSGTDPAPVPGQTGQLCFGGRGKRRGSRRNPRNPGSKAARTPPSLCPQAGQGEGGPGAAPHLPPAPASQF